VLVQPDEMRGDAVYPTSYAGRQASCHRTLSIRSVNEVCRAARTQSQKFESRTIPTFYHVSYHLFGYDNNMVKPAVACSRIRVYEAGSEDDKGKSRMPRTLFPDISHILRRAIWRNGTVPEGRVRGGVSGGGCRGELSRGGVGGGGVGG